jgi:hypothetical protein
MSAGLADHASAHEVVLFHEAVDHGRGRLRAGYLDIDLVLGCETLRVLSTGIVCA